MERVIVSRHPAAIEFIAQQLSDENHNWSFRNKDVLLNPMRPILEERFYSPTDEGYTDWKLSGQTIPIFSQIDSVEQIQGKIVYGNLPLNLASVADSVFAIEFSKGAPRGQEYTLED